jgi:BirA family biotin operon repressor/biotin-[acetyl-CoA-carboxylase] ligase
LADSTFDRADFERRLATRRLGRTLLSCAETASTNDLAWEALAAGAADGTAVVADAQTQGRGREGRAWHHAPGKGLALSLLVRAGCERGQNGTLPLLAGLALARALDSLGAPVDLKWPNDLLAQGRKVSGILCESRRLPNGGEAVVIGVGVNVAQRREDFPKGLRDTATSLAIAGCGATREAVAAAFLNALEPLWVELQEGRRAAVLDAWKRRAGFWGQAVTVRAPGGPMTGVARDLSDEGGLVLRLEGGGEAVALAGDLELSRRAEPA